MRRVYGRPCPRGCGRNVETEPHHEGGAYFYECSKSGRMGRRHDLERCSELIAAKNARREARASAAAGKRLAKAEEVGQLSLLGGAE